MSGLAGRLLQASGQRIGTFDVRVDDNSNYIERVSLK
jgi:hypothetical protein